MKQYPSISRDPIRGTPFYVFDKLDGSNIRAEWHPKKGFWKYGSRTQLIDTRTGHLGRLAIPLIKAQEESFTSVLKALRCQEAICFFEFFGPSSFAGVHDYEEAGHKAVFIDITLFKQGFMLPSQFLKTFQGNVTMADLLYHGNITEEFIHQVKQGTLRGVTSEGVVCKGTPLKNGYPPHMFKIKSQAWIDRVKSLYTDPKLLEELL